MRISIGQGEGEFDRNLYKIIDGAGAGGAPENTADFNQAIIYSITETARKNGLNVYYYIRQLLTELF